MKILFTGASSFTGCWFVSRLASAGHDVRTTFTRGNAEAYGDDLRSRRMKQVAVQSKPLFSCSFGDDRFLEYLKHERIDMLCHHAADATNYKSADFDVCQAVSKNTRRIQEVLKLLAQHSGAAFLLTGSIFEGGEGAGSDGLPPLSPYGLSKSLTAEICKYYCRVLGVPMGKFVIPNPIGPWEDARFTSYLMRTWSTGDLATVRTPAYIRDNIHVSLLTPAYIAFVELLSKNSAAFIQTNPSGYVESQGAFAERVAREMRSRTSWECKLELANQTEFAEPEARFNTDPVDGKSLGWNEPAAWDEFAQWYMA